MSAFRRQDLLIQLVKREFQSRYLGSVLGLTWAFIQPLCMMGVLYVVMRFGLKLHMQGDENFLVWFFSGMIAWNFFAEIVSGGPNLYGEYRYLIKKVNFDLTILPVARALASVLLHIIFVAIVLGIASSAGIFPSLQLLTLPYYIAATFLLALPLAWIAACLHLFLKDIGQAVSIVIQFGFWASPVLWRPENLPESIRHLVFLNPVYYVIDGYRNCFLTGNWPWQGNLGHLLYFWALVLGLNVVSWLVYKKLRSYFGDVI